MTSINMGYWKLPGQYNRLTLDNIARYNKMRREKVIEPVPLNPTAYRADLLSRFGPKNRRKSSPDFFYSYSDLNSNLRSRKIVGVLENYVPEARFYTNEISSGEYKKSILTRKGKLFALPYYGAHSAFLYNESHVRKAGFSEPPMDWSEVVEQALRIKKKGISKTPILVPLHGDGSVETLYALILGMNPKADSYLFDNESRPNFDQEGSPLFVVLEWLLDGMYNKRVTSPGCTVFDVVPAARQVKSGRFSFVWLPWYLLSFINYPMGRRRSPIKEGLNPGYGYTTCYTRTYTVSLKALEDRLKLKDLWHVLEYFGGKTDEDYNSDSLHGKYRVAHRLALELGVPSPIDALWKDEEYLSALDRWGDMEVYKEQDKKVFNSLNDPTSPPWLAEWDGEWQKGPLRNTVHEVLSKNIEIAELLRKLKKLTKEWNTLRAKYPNWADNEA